MSPNIAKLALTPPVVGCVKTMIDNNPASLCFSLRLKFLPFAPKIRYLPAFWHHHLYNIKSKVVFLCGQLYSSSNLFSYSRWHASHEKLESITPITHGRPLIFPVPVITASFMPVCFWSLSNLSLYPGKSSGSTLIILASVSLNVPSSINWRILSLAEILNGWWHLGHT